MRERFAFREAFMPVVNVGEILKCIPKNLYYEVEYIEALPYMERDFGVLAAGVETAETEVTDVYLDDNEIGQFRFSIIDEDVKITHLAQPKGVRRWVTKQSSWEAVYELPDPRANPLMEHYHLNEIFQYADTKLYIKLLSALGVAQSRVAFHGFRFAVKPVREQRIFTSIPTEGYRHKA